MLKAQLRSKLFQFDPEWADKEDILTGDFFGALDYLPRQPYLYEFLEAVCLPGRAGERLELGQVDWQQVDMLFWPRHRVGDDTTEPDVMLLSNRWIIVVEVKLGSGLGGNQPWREYLVGRKLAEDRSLPSQFVHYLILSRERLDPAKVFGGLKDEQRAELVERTLFFRWSQVVSLVERWLRNGAGGRPVSENEARLLGDLRAVLRRRRTLAFLGFSFTHQQPVEEPERAIFCPSLFQGFLSGNPAGCSSPPSVVFLSRFRGFLRRLQAPPTVPMESLRLRRFPGLLRSSQPTGCSSVPIFSPSRFEGFAKEASRCAASATMAPAFRKETTIP